MVTKIKVGQTWVEKYGPTPRRLRVLAKQDVFSSYTSLRPWSTLFTVQIEGEAHTAEFPIHVLRSNWKPLSATETSKK